ncbi:MAG: hypothetical protein F4038_12005, partial [Chloroflexi bacterium]|nr:hypothetical protein [Chloroflexota bacterium]
MGNETPWWYRPSEAKRHLRTNVVRAGASPERDPSVRHWIEQHAPRLHIPLLARGRAPRPLVPVSALLALTLLLAVRPGVGADANCDVPPINLTSALGEENASVVLSWESSGECTPDEYAIYRRDMDVEGSRMTKIDSVNGDVLTYTDTTVNAGEDYRYRVRSNDQGSRSGRTDITIPEATVSEPEPESESVEESSESQPRSVPRNEVTLVSNTGQADSEFNPDKPYAQNFSTGSNLDGYTVTSAAIELAAAPAAGVTIAVAIYTVKSDSDPDSSLYTLTAPASLVSGVNTFTAPPNSTLDASTEYAVVVVPSAEINLRFTTADAEDSGGADGWSIAHEIHYWDDLEDLNNPVGRPTGISGSALQIEVKGTIVPPDTTSPTLDTATVDGSSLILTYDETLDSGSTPLASAYSVTVAGTSAAPSSVSISGMAVTLTLASTVFSGQTVTVSYTVPTGMGATPVQDEAGNDAVALTNRSVTNNTANNAPSFNAGLPTSISVAENTASGVNIGSPFTATDPDTGDTLTYWLTGTDASSFSIVSTNGQIQTSAALNFESKSSYSVTVNVRDSKDASGNTDTVADDTHSLTISVSNVNEPPSIGGLTTSQLNEGTSTSHVINTYIAPDPEDDSLTWSLAGTDAGDFTINSSTGALRFSAVPDYEDPADHNDDNTYELIVQVTDGKNAQGGTDNTVDDTHEVTITVINVNEAPEITTTGTAFTSISTPEGTLTTEALAVYMADDPEAGGDVLTWTLGGDDAARFTIIGNVAGEARLRFQAILDFESPLDDGMSNVYNVTVRVRDSKINTVGSTNGDPDSAVDDSINVVVTVTNVDEPGTVTITGMESGGELLTASVTDIDGTVSSASWSWHRQGSTPGSFSGIPGATSNTYTTVAADVGKKLKAIVLYTDPQGSGKSANAETGTIGASNVEPEFSSMTASRSVAENSGSGVNVGAMVSATGGDSDPLHYTLSGTDASSFTIVANSGQIQTTNASYNYESKSSYTVTVNVSDSKDAAGNDDSNSVDDSITVTINLEDVNEQPTITTSAMTASVAENTPATTGIITFEASDPDAGTTYSWSVEPADDGGKFDISSSGVLTFQTSPNYEMPTDAGMDNVYDVTVKVTDNGTPAMSDTHQFAVTVTNVNEAPRITSTGSSHTDPTFDEIEYDADAQGLTVNLVVATYTASDVDADDTGTNWTWHLSGNDAGDFTITRNADGDGVLSFSQRPDFEDPVDADTMNDYDLAVIVRDDGNLEDTLGVEVRIEGVNERPRVIGDTLVDLDEVEFDLTDAEVALERLLEVFDYDATDEENDTITWSIIADPPDTASVGHMEINATTGLLSFKSDSRPNFEFPVDGNSDNTYAIRVLATDDDPDDPRNTEVGVLVRIQNKNETPEIPAGVPDEDFAEIEWDAESVDLDVRTYIPRDEETSTADLTQLSWSLTGTDVADFQITEHATTGHGTLSFRNRPNFEDPTDRANTTDGHMADDNVYQVILRISDGPNTREYPTTVTVTNINETPEFTHSIHPTSAWNADEIEYDSGTTAANMASIPATPPNQAYWYAFEARDEEGDDITWTITGLDAADFVIAEDPDFVMTADSDERAIARWNIVPDRENPMGLSPDVPDHGYVFTVNASDGVNTAMHNVFIRIDDVNERPEFTGTVETAIALDEHDATLDASSQEPPYTFPTIASYTARDEEGGVRWSLTGTDAADLEIDSGGNVVFKETPSFEDPKDSGGDNVYEFTVVTTDILSKTNRRTAEQPVTVTVRDIEEEGHVAIAEGDESPGVDDSVTFELTDPDGEIDVDRTGDPRWQVQRGTSGSWSTVSTVITGAASYSYTVQEGDAGHQLRVMVTYKDRRGEDKMATSAPTDVVTMDPRANVPPRLRSGVFTTSEGPANIDFGTLDATDRDNDRITFAMLEQQDHALFELSESGRLRAIQALNFEDGSTLNITITLSDGKGLDSNGDVIDDDSVDLTTGVSIILFDVEEEGVITFSPLEPEAGTAQAATVTDDDGGVTGRSWQWWRSQDGRTGWSPISGATDNSYTSTVNDEDFYLRASVEYTDRRGGGKRAAAITGPVPSENRRPLFPSSETGQRTVDENSRSGTNVGAPVAADDPERDRLTYSLSGTDAAAFSITSSGQIRVGPGTTLDFETKPSYSVTVQVHDGKDSAGATSTAIDDTQNVTITLVNLEEPGAVTLSSETSTIQARVPVTATLEDDDIPTNVTWQWSRSRSSTSGWANIAGATSATFTPDDADIGGYIRAIASYDDAEDVGKTAVKVSPRVGQPPPVNSAPAFPATERGQRELAEDATGGIAVGDPVAATDFNNDPLTYTLSGTDAALFTIGSTDGQLRVASGAELDFETKRTLRVTVEVTDGANALGDPDDDAIDDRQSVTITLTDVNEAPTVSGDATPSFEENSDRPIATYTGTDPERDTLSWSVDNDDDFFITQSGQLYFASPPNYEDQTSYLVTITATDDDPIVSLSGSLSITVTVTDVEEPGVVTITPLRGWIGTRFEAELIDGDGRVTGETWKWERSRNRSSWEEITGASQVNYTADAEDVGHYLRATVSYSDRRGGNKEASAEIRSLIGEAQPTTTNNAPGFDEASTTRSIRQGSGKGRPVGAPVKADDPDQGEVLTYELEGSEEEHFTIDPLTGQIWTKDVLVEGEEYSVNVEVRDGFDDFYNPNDGVDDSIEVVITVTG